MKVKLVAVIITLLTMQSAHAQSASAWINNKVGLFGNASNWANGVPSQTNGVYNRVSITLVNASITNDIDRIGNLSVSQWYQTSRTTNEFTTAYKMNIVSNSGGIGRLTLVSHGSSSGKAYFTATGSGGTVTADQLIMAPYSGVSANANLYLRSYNGGILSFKNTGILKISSTAVGIQSNSTVYQVRAYQLGDIYFGSGLEIDVASGTSSNGASITNWGELNFSAWNKVHYGEVVIGAFVDSSGMITTNSGAYFKLTDGARLNIEKAAYEPTENFTKTLIHMVSEEDWDGSFKSILVNNQAVGFGEWLAIDTYAYGDTTNIWYYQIQKTAADDDGIANDVALNVRSSIPQPGSISLISLGIVH